MDGQSRDAYSNTSATCYDRWLAEIGKFDPSRNVTIVESLPGVFSVIYHIFGSKLIYCMLIFLLV